MSRNELEEYLNPHRTRAKRIVSAPFSPFLKLFRREKWGASDIVTVVLTIIFGCSATYLAFLALPEATQNDLLGRPTFTPTPTLTHTPTLTPTPSPTSTLTPTSTSTNTPTLTPSHTPTIPPTPLEGIPFAENEIGVVLANFEDFRGEEGSTEWRIERQVEEAEIPLIRVNHQIEKREHAQQVSDIYNETILIWGVRSSDVVEVFFEVTPRRSEVERTIENKIVIPWEFKDFTIYVRDGLDTLYLVKFIEGQIFYFEDDFVNALDAFDQAISILPADERQEDLQLAPLFFYRGITHSQLQNYLSAIGDYTRAIQLDNSYASAYNSRGNTYYSLGEYQLAVNDYNQAIQLDKNYAKAYSNRGLAYLFLNEYQLAIDDYNHAIKLDDSVPLVYNNLGLAYHSLSEYQLAIENYNHSIQLDENYVNAYVNRSNVYVDLGEYQLAIDDYNHAIQLDENNVDSHFNRGLLYIFVGEYQLAIDDFSRVIQLDMNDVYAYNNRGVAYANMGKYQLAFSDYNQAIELDENFGDAYLNLANAYIDNQNYDAALESLQTYVDIIGQENVPNDISQLIEELEAIVGDGEASVPQSS